MRQPSITAGLFLLACAVSAGAAAQGASAPAAAAAPVDAAKAADRCESSVTETIMKMRGRDAREVQFVGAKRALTPTSDEETGVRGEGRYRAAAGGSTTFTYTCYFNIKTGETSGVVFRDTGGAAPVAEKAWVPDLTNISPEACESATAAELKKKHPRVGRIALGSDSRRVSPGPNGHILLEGQGAVERAPGMNAVPFTYRCEFDGRGGRIVGVSTSQ
jgi:hypothetical protein